MITCYPTQNLRFSLCTFEEEWWQNAGDLPSALSVLDKSKYFQKKINQNQNLFRTDPKKRICIDLKVLLQYVHPAMQHECMKGDRRHKDLLALIWVDVHNSLMFSPLIIQSSQNDASKTCISDQIIVCLDLMIHLVIYRKHSLRTPLYKMCSDFTHFKTFPYVWSMLKRPGALATGSSWLGLSKRH